MITRMGVSIFTLFGVGTLLSCASSPSKDWNSPDASEGAETRSSSNSSESESASRPRSSYSDADVNATADTCSERPCYSDGDCCKGASCGIDPERSHVQRYCLGL